MLRAGKPNKSSEAQASAGGLDRVSCIHFLGAPAEDLKMASTTFDAILTTRARVGVGIGRCFTDFLRRTADVAIPVAVIVITTA